MSLLAAEGVTVRYGGVHAVESVDFEVTPGAIHGIIGPNGAGKSTFMDALSGRHRLAGGKVLYDGQDISTKSPMWRRLHGISRSFQRASVFNSLTVRAQLEMVAWRTKERRLDHVIEALHLQDLLAHRCDAISYGDQRRVDLAMALTGHPRVLLLDEPGAGLVADEARLMLDHVSELCAEWGVGAVLVEHNVEGVFRVCSDVSVFNMGRVLTSGKPEEVRRNKQVIEAYLGSSA